MYFACKCSMCQDSPIKKRTVTQVRDSALESKAPGNLYDQDLSFILKRLSPVPGQEKAYQFVSTRVLETVIYSQGVA